MHIQKDLTHVKTGQDFYIQFPRNFTLHFHGAKKRELKLALPWYSSKKGKHHNMELPNIQYTL